MTRESISTFQSSLTYNLFISNILQKELSLMTLVIRSSLRSTIQMPKTPKIPQEESESNVHPLQLSGKVVHLSRTYHPRSQISYHRHSAKHHQQRLLLAFTNFHNNSLKISSNISKHSFITGSYVNTFSKKNHLNRA